jgi:hypothetical protein
MISLNNRMPKEFRVGTKEELKTRQKEWDKKFFLRAIKFPDLAQLVREGADSFHFKNGIYFMNHFGLVEQQFLCATGVIVLHEASEETIDYFCSAEKYHGGFGDKGYPVCCNEFQGQVEVYSVKDEDYSCLVKRIEHLL